MKFGLTRFERGSLYESGRRWNRQGAFTLPNLLVSMGIFMMVIGGVLASHLFGLRMVEFTKIKLTVNDAIPRGIEQMREEVHSAKIVRVGLGTQTSFTEATNNTPQQGNAIQIYPTSDTNVFIRYYLDGSSKALQRLATNAVVTIMADIVANLTVFTAEDFRGNVLTNKDDRSIIGLNLQLSQLRGSGIQFGPGNHYTSYQMRHKMARRTG